MARPKSAGMSAYKDIEPLMYRALNEPFPIEVQCYKEGDAIRLVQRLNQCRIRDRETNYQRELNDPLPPDDRNDPRWPERVDRITARERGETYQSFYDVLSFRRRETLVIIERRPDQPWMRVTTGGKEIQIPRGKDYIDRMFDRMRDQSTPPDIKTDVYGPYKEGNRDDSKDFGTGGLGLDTDDNSC